MPRDLFEELGELRNVDLNGFLWPESIALDRLETACLVFTKGFGDEIEKSNVRLEVDGYSVQIQDRMRNQDDTRDVCRLIINGIQILHVEAPES